MTNLSTELFAFICYIERKYNFALRQPIDSSWHDHYVSRHEVFIAIASYLDISLEEAVKQYSPDYVMEKLI